MHWIAQFDRDVNDSSASELQVRAGSLWNARNVKDWESKNWIRSAGLSARITWRWRHHQLDLRDGKFDFDSPFSDGRWRQNRLIHLSSSATLVKIVVKGTTDPLERFIYMFIYANDGFQLIGRLRLEPDARFGVGNWSLEWNVKSRDSIN